MAELTVLVVIAVLIAVNGLFVAAEFAIIGTSRAAMRARAERGDRRAHRVPTVLADPVRQDRFIATAQLGITLASLGLGMYGEHAVAGWIVGGFERVGWAQWAGAHALASVLAIAALSYLHVVIGEMVPKSLALSRANDTAVAVTGVMLWIQRLLQPLVLGLNGVGNALLRMVGIDRREAKARHHTPEELELVVAESQRGGALPEIPGALVRELLDFFELTAEQVMVPRVHVVGVPLGATRPQVAAILGRELHEEDADARPEIVRLGDDALLAQGTARLEEIGEALDLELDHPEVDTLSGLVLDLLGHPASAGDRVTWGEVEITVVSADGRGVGRSSVRRRDGADDGEVHRSP